MMLPQLYLDVSLLLCGLSATSGLVYIVPGGDSSSFVIPIGGTASFRCLVSSSLTISKWTNGSRDVVASSRVQFSNNLETLTIFSVTYADEGEYNCYATSTGGEVEHASASLFVVGRPFAVASNATVHPGERAVLTCTGTHFNYINWDFKREPVNDDSNHILQDHDLIVKSVLPDDVGVYRCRAFNQFYSVSVYSHLRIKVNCNDDTNVVNKVVGVGAVVTLCCGNKTEDKDTVAVWQRNGVALNAASNRRLYLSMKSSLIIANAQYNDSGIYECVRDSKSFATNLTVEGFPPQPVIQEMKLYEDLLMFVQWSIPTITPQHPVTRFRVSCRPSEQEEWSNVTTSPSARSATVDCNVAQVKEKVKECVMYDLVVTAINSQGETPSQLSRVQYSSEILCHHGGGVSLHDQKNKTDESDNTTKTAIIATSTLAASVVMIIIAIVLCYCRFHETKTL
ncbi:peroxidasin homolog isoform X2 [Corticium candelabrum]|uniref:peroxidasin homolog isoform X2 n=1 Tax=Corticium candelabrum TaxID=121492 RepID=UPI002E25A671|nr:peroxidasin homolog isoform X2 [Corticium candelabrum]